MIDKFLLALHSFPQFGSRRLHRLMSAFASPEACFRASRRELLECGLKEAVTDAFLVARSRIDPDAQIPSLEREGISALSINDSEYPELLKQIYDPPYLLYYRGNVEALRIASIGIVGTRECSPYGQQVCYQLTRTLSEQGLAIASGLALGIDSIAHSTALECGAPTIAVLGSGLDERSLYPPSNRQLARRIAASGGIVITEFPLGTEPLRYNFPMRNRIISGLSLGVLVVEAAIKSGAMITARYALEQGRELFAVPGNILSPISAGPNSLIRDGAIPALSADDILAALDFKGLSSYSDNVKKTSRAPEASDNEPVALPTSNDPLEQKILDMIGHKTKHIDELSRESGIGHAALSAALTVMEIKGLVRNIGAARYVI